METNDPTASRAQSPTRDPDAHADLMKLPDVIFWKLAREHLTAPKDICHLAQTCKRLRDLLDPLIYRSEVLIARKECFLFAYADISITPCRWKPEYSPYHTPSLSLERGLGDGAWVKWTSPPALHWAIEHEDHDIGLALFKKCLAAALKYWPTYITLAWERYGHYIIRPLWLAVTCNNPSITIQLLAAFDTLGFGPISRQARLAEAASDPAPEAKITSNLLISVKVDNLRQDVLFSWLVALVLRHEELSMLLLEQIGHLDHVPAKAHEFFEEALSLAVQYGSPNIVRRMQELDHHKVLYRERRPGAPNCPLYQAVKDDGNEELLALLIDNAIFVPVPAHSGGKIQKIKFALALALAHESHRNAWLLCNYLQPANLPACMRALGDLELSCLASDKLLRVTEAFLDAIPTTDVDMRHAIQRLALRSINTHSKNPAVAILCLKHRTVDLSARAQPGTLLFFPCPNDVVDGPHPFLNHFNLGQAMLHAAVLSAYDRPRPDVIQQLLEVGKGIIDVNARDKNGITALKIASARGYDNIVSLLKEHGARDEGAMVLSEEQTFFYKIIPFTDTVRKTRR
ncbi:hypothetical protein F4780DRAFT_795828 [Xylariomycetidae sp. FL0641]|nr:hypothetical protein F4780DRAFT_795828 [Xylariomycetidae sp. FL0641]